MFLLWWNNEYILLYQVCLVFYFKLTIPLYLIFVHAVKERLISLFFYRNSWLFKDIFWKAVHYALLCSVKTSHLTSIVIGLFLDSPPFGFMSIHSLIILWSNYCSFILNIDIWYNMHSLSFPSSFFNSYWLFALSHTF